MAHTKAQGAANRHVNIAGKRLGMKRSAGQFITAGTIIVRQRGSRFHPGKNADMGTDYTIYSKIDGYVAFRNMTGSHRLQKYIDVLPEQVVKTVTSIKKAVTPKATKAVKKSPVKKVATK